MCDARVWDFDSYPWVDDDYDGRMRRTARLCYDETLRALPSLAGAQPGHVVLDIGAGTGNSALPFLEQGCRVVGVDPSVRMLKHAQAKVEAWAGRLALVLARDPFLSLPVAGKTVDIVACAYAIHHLDDGAKGQAAREAHRVLRPGGAWVAADTMFRDEAHKAEALRARGDLEDEYQPLLTTFPLLVEQAGFVDVRLHQTGELVWVLVSRRGRT